MDKQHINRLYQKHKSKTLTEAEQFDWKAVLTNGNSDPSLMDSIDVDWEQLDMNNLKQVNPAHSRQMLGYILAQTQQKPTRSLLMKFLVAAAMATIVYGLVFFYYRSDKKQEQTAHLSEVVMGRQAATLTLANGKKIRLSDALNGKLAEDAGVKISKTADGQVIYEVIGVTGQSGAEQLKYNTLSTANGETYVLVLPDKSKVWMNAASSLTYPATLTKNGIRSVKLEGEAYFEVAEDKKHPFVVESRGQKVKVLGTHFNINAYRDERFVKTTLLQGKVEISLQSETNAKMALQRKVLKPGEQSATWSDSSEIAIKDVDVNDAVDWKNGEFAFNNESLESVLRKVARWYDVEIIYKGGNQKSQFWGGVSRYTHLKDVLEKLELTGNVHFSVEGRRVYVTK